MSFKELMTDSVDLIKADGTRKVGLKASVQKTKIFMAADGLLIEPEDLILRKMSNGAEETYRVIDPGFHERFHSIPAGYQMDVIKLGLPEAKRAVQSVTYNFNGHNARVNQNSTDNSTNVVNIDARVVQHIEDLRNGILHSDLAESEKEEAIEIIDEVDSAFRSGKPKKSVVSSLLKALPHVANITTTVSALVSML